MTAAMTAGMTAPRPGLRVLIVDDDRNILRTLVASLKALGCSVQSAATFEIAQELITQSPPDLVLTDIRLGSRSGIDLIAAGAKVAPTTLFVAMTAFAAVDNAVAAIKAGAFDYLPKPFTVSHLEILLQKVRTVLDLRRENAALRRFKGEVDTFAGCTSPAMTRLASTLKQVAPTDATVLLVGESGTGKSSCARLIHRLSNRHAGPFVEVNCASLAESLIESELFGHVKGAFTGAATSRIGKLALAQGGTVFLDEIAELGPSGQAKLLRFLQERVVERLGDSSPIVIDARVIAATNRQLPARVAAGQFREDLYFRLNVFECQLAPLRDRREDVDVLMEQILTDLSRAHHAARRPEITAAVKDRLYAYDWPGNIRELRNVLERLTILASGRATTLDDLPESIRSASPLTAARGFHFQSLEELEREHILQVIAHEPNLERAARILGITTVTLWRKRREYGLR